MGTQGLLLADPLGLAEQFGDHQQIQQFQGVVDGLALQIRHRRRDHGPPLGRGVAAQRGGLGSHPGPGQLQQPPSGNARVADQRGQPALGDLARSCEGLLQIPTGGLAGKPLRQRSSSHTLASSTTTSNSSRRKRSAAVKSSPRVL
ncbi:MAG: hypothetical protein WBL53_02620 [Pseudonocardiaceae bacterium]